MLVTCENDATELTLEKSNDVPNVVEEKGLTIVKQNSLAVMDKKTPFLLTTGSSLSMCVMVIISIVTAVDGCITGVATMGQTIFSMLTTTGMLAGVLALPVIQKRFNTKYIEEKKLELIEEKDNVKKDIIELEEIKKDSHTISNIPIGYSIEDTNLCYYDFKNNFITIITAVQIEKARSYCFKMLQIIMQTDDTELIVLYAEKKIAALKVDYNKEYNSIKDKVKNKDKHVLCVIIGIENFFNWSNINFAESLAELKKDGNCSFVFVESSDKLNSYMNKEWYKNNIKNNSGIWVGNGFANQKTINSENKDSNVEIEVNYLGYVVKDGKAIFVKF